MKLKVFLLSILILSINAQEKESEKQSEAAKGEASTEGSSEGGEGAIRGDEEFKLLQSIANYIVGSAVLVYLMFFLALAIGYGLNWCCSRYQLNKANKSRLNNAITDDYSPRDNTRINNQPVAYINPYNSRVETDDYKQD